MSGNIYAGVPTDIKGRVKTAATKALESDVREAIHLIKTFGDAEKLASVISILESLIGEADDQ